MKIFNLKIIFIITIVIGLIGFWTIRTFSNQHFISKSNLLTPKNSPKSIKTPPKNISEDKIINPYQEFRFEDYPVFEIYKGKTAKLDIPKDDFDRERLQWAIDNQKVNFAGHYILTNWSCGMWCSRFAVIDAKTGKIDGVDVSPQVCLPHLKEEFVCNENFQSIDYTIDSKLLILFGIRYKNNSDGERGFHYYKFENGKFIHLKSIMTKEQRDAIQIKFGESDEKDNKKLDCNKPSEYSFVIVENPNRGVGDIPVPKDLDIVIGKDVVAKIELPIADTEAKNFRLISVEKDKIGFEIKVNWGGGNYYYDIQYNFKCKENNFYLYKVKKDSFSTTNPDSGNLLDKKKTKIIKIEPNIPIEKLVMVDYLQ